MNSLSLTITITTTKTNSDFKLINNSLIIITRKTNLFNTGYGLLGKDGNNSKIHFWFHSDPISHKPIQTNRVNKYSNYHSFNIAQTTSTNGRIFVGKNMQNIVTIQLLHLFYPVEATLAINK